MARKTQECLRPFDSTIFNGRDYPSFSKLINDCIISANCSPEDIIIIANDKVRGDASYIDGILSKLHDGYGLASFYRFGFFGFKLELICHIGLFDENFKQGGYEDVDFKNRLIEANIGIFETTTCPYEESGSRWKSNNNKEYYKSKWYEIIGEPFCNYCKKDGNDPAYSLMSCHRSNVIVRLKEESSEMIKKSLDYFGPYYNPYYYTKKWRESVLPANNEHLRYIEVVNGIY